MYLIEGQGELPRCDSNPKIPLGINEKCNKLNNDGDKCNNSLEGDSEGNYTPCEYTNNNGIESCKVSGEPVCYDVRANQGSPPPNTTPTPTPTEVTIPDPEGGNDLPEKTDLNLLLDVLQTQLSGNFMLKLGNMIESINNESGGKLYDNENGNDYLSDIKRITFLDLGNPTNTTELDFVENVMINFIELPTDALANSFIEYCPIDLNVTLLLSLAILYNKNNTNFDEIKNNDLTRMNNILNRLSRYFPDFFQKILNIMKSCDPSSNRYDIIQSIYDKMFKYNNTNVSMFGGFKSLIDYLKQMKTIEMIVIIICITFVISKIISMFSVKLSA